MKTVVVLIGNSDDKLSQKEWSHFYDVVWVYLSNHSIDVHFSGTSIPNRSWQNACFVASVPDEEILPLKTRLSHFKEYFKQNSIAILIGDTEFI